MLKGVLSPVGTRGRAAAKRQREGPRLIEQLEPRVLLSADLIGMDMAAPLEMPLGELAIDVDLDQQEDQGLQEDDPSLILSYLAQGGEQHNAASASAPADPAEAMPGNADIPPSAQDELGSVIETPILSDGSIPQLRDGPSCLGGVGRQDVVSAVEQSPIEARAPPAWVVPELPGLHLVDPDPVNLAGQVIYLDFDGEVNVTYNGPVRVGPFDVPAFQATGDLADQEEAIIDQVLGQLQETFRGSGVVFTTQRPAAGQPYSTIYVGGDDSAFIQYGSFLGLAEQVDVGNRDWADDALVFSASVTAGASEAEACASQVVELVAHESAHLLGWSHYIQPDDEDLMAVANGAGGPTESVLLVDAHAAPNLEITATSLNSFTIRNRSCVISFVVDVYKHHQDGERLWSTVDDVTSPRFLQPGETIEITGLDPIAAGECYWVEAYSLARHDVPRSDPRYDLSREVGLENFIDLLAAPGIKLIAKKMLPELAEDSLQGISEQTVRALVDAHLVGVEMFEQDWGVAATEVFKNIFFNPYVLKSSIASVTGMSVSSAAVAGLATSIGMLVAFAPTIADLYTVQGEQVAALCSPTLSAQWAVATNEHGTDARGDPHPWKQEVPTLHVGDNFAWYLALYNNGTGNIENAWIDVNLRDITGDVVEQTTNIPGIGFNITWGMGGEGTPQGTAPVTMYAGTWPAAGSYNDRNRPAEYMAAGNSAS